MSKPSFSRISTRNVAVSLLLLALTACGSPTSPEPADLIILGGKIITLEEAHPEVSAIAAKDGIIIALGDDSSMDAWTGESTEILRLNGELVTPGLIEAHGHFEGFGNQLNTLDLTQTQSWQEIVDAVSARVATTPEGQWIIGRGWHQEKWADGFEPEVEGYPVHDDLSAISPNHPVALTHASGHATLINLQALQLSGIDRKTPNPDGGTILRKANGEPTGVLRETASNLVRQAIAPLNDSSAIRTAKIANIKAAIQGSLKAGITSFHDAGVSFEDADIFKDLADQGELSVRLFVMLREPSTRLEQLLDGSRLIGHADNFLTVRSIKLSIDGALGSHGAWLLDVFPVERSFPI